jgi:hypothetical protein
MEIWRIEFRRHLLALAMHHRELLIHFGQLAIIGPELLKLPLYDLDLTGEIIYL